MRRWAKFWIEMRSNGATSTGSSTGARNSSRNHHGQGKKSAVTRRDGGPSEASRDAGDGPGNGWATDNEGDETSPVQKEGKQRREASQGSHQTGHSTSSPQEPAQLSEFDKKKQTFITRTVWTLVMIFIFFASMFSGHIYLIIVVTAVQLISFKEVIAIANVPSRARSLRFTKTLNWYFLGTTMYFLYGESVIYYFKHNLLLIDRLLLPLATHHRFISFMLYVMG